MKKILEKIPSVPPSTHKFVVHLLHFLTPPVHGLTRFLVWVTSDPQGTRGYQKKFDQNRLKPRFLTLFNFYIFRGPECHVPYIYIYAVLECAHL